MNKRAPTCIIAVMDEPGQAKSEGDAYKCANNQETFAFALHMRLQTNLFMSEFQLHRLAIDREENRIVPDFLAQDRHAAIEDFDAGGFSGHHGLIVDEGEAFVFGTGNTFQGQRAVVDRRGGCDGGVIGGLSRGFRFFGRFYRDGGVHVFDAGNFFHGGDKSLRAAFEVAARADPVAGGIQHNEGGEAIDMVGLSQPLVDLLLSGGKKGTKSL